MKEKVYRTVKKYDLLEDGERVVVALSGGPDSTALLSVLHLMASKLNLDLIVAHFNHRLRGKESDEDERFCRTLAKNLGLTFRAGKMDLRKGRKGISPEDFYRRERYDFLEQVAAESKAHKIALGHNLQDQAETVLLNLLRGSGLEGLKGFLPKRNGRIVRPLIEVSRGEIIAYLKKFGISYRQDSSNESTVYLRNQIRADLIPYLKQKFNPKIEENLAHMAEILRQEDEYIKRCVVETMQSPFIKRGRKCISLRTDFINALPPALRWRLFKTITEDLSPSRNGISLVHIKSLDKLSLHGETGKKLNLPSGIAAGIEYGDLILERAKVSSIRKGYDYAIKIPGSVYIKERKIRITSVVSAKKRLNLKGEGKVYLDLDKIEGLLSVRTRRAGDWFVPLGMPGCRQKIKKLFIDRKIPSGRRDDIMLLCDSTSVIWIENVHLSDRVKITPRTKNVLKLEFTSKIKEQD